MATLITLDFKNVLLLNVIFISIFSTSLKIPI